LQLPVGLPEGIIIPAAKAAEKLKTAIIQRKKAIIT
jgi:hypothetical protein